jgi:hypothetical protein
VIKVGGLVSYDLSQPGVVDANFSGEQKLTLSGDGNRPVYVSAASIDPATGAVSAAESRRSPEFGRVARRVSDLRGYGGQLTLGVAPDVFRFRTSALRPVHILNYTLQESRRQYRGFDGAGFGDPRQVEWAPSPSDARHVVVVTAGVRNDNIGVITLFGRAQSGLPFTPCRAGRRERRRPRFDRAFIPNPATETDPAVAASIRTLLDAGSSTSKRCVEAYLGRVAERNGCRGPWTQSLNVQWRPPMPRRWGGPRNPSDVPAECSGGSRSARARQQHARLGIARHAGPGAVRAARLRRERAALPLRREPALRRHAARIARCCASRSAS